MLELTKKQPHSILKGNFRDILEVFKLNEISLDLEIELKFDSKETCLCWFYFKILVLLWVDSRDLSKVLERA